MGHKRAAYSKYAKILPNKSPISFIVFRHISFRLGVLMQGGIFIQLLLKYPNVAIPATSLQENRCKSISWRSIVARKHAQNQLEEIYKAVEANPGQRPGFIARILGIHRSQIARSLPAMQERGHLLSEDEKGGLWIFQRGK